MNKKYIKPKCDCGSVLKIFRSEMWLVTRSITNEGEFGKIVNIGTVFDDSDYEFELFCRKCGNKYEGDYDDSNRVYPWHKKTVMKGWFKRR